MVRSTGKFVLKHRKNEKSKNYKILVKSKKDLKVVIDVFKKVLHSYTNFILAIALETYEANADLERINRKLIEEYSSFLHFFMKNDPNFGFLNTFKAAVFVNIMNAAKKGKIFWKEDMFSDKSLFAEVQKNLNELLKRNSEGDASCEELCQVSKNVAEISDEINELKNNFIYEWKEECKLLSERRKASLAKKFTKRLLKSLKYKMVDLNVVENESCPICLDRFVQPIGVACDHVFCRKCVSKSLLHAKLCPLCKSDLV